MQVSSCLLVILMWVVRLSYFRLVFTYERRIMFWEFILYLLAALLMIGGMNLESVHSRPLSIQFFFSVVTLNHVGSSKAALLLEEDSTHIQWHFRRIQLHFEGWRPIIMRSIGIWDEKLYKNMVYGSMYKKKKTMVRIEFECVRNSPW